MARPVPLSCVTKKEPRAGLGAVSSGLCRDCEELEPVLIVAAANPKHARVDVGKGGVGHLHGIKPSGFEVVPRPEGAASRKADCRTFIDLPSSERRNRSVRPAIKGLPFMASSVPMVALGKSRKLFNCKLQEFVT